MQESIVKNNVRNYIISTKNEKRERGIVMYVVNVNGKDYQSEEDLTLMDFLRNRLGITSVKNGCKEGACGTCTVIVDGKTVRACIMKLSKLEGKKVQTIEGFTQRERDVFVYAFAAAGAVQCGFCIPGMVMAAEALLSKIPNPTDSQIREGLSGNLCRCTGYNAIVNAIHIAAKEGNGLW